MQQQSWLATCVFAVIAFAGGYMAAWHAPAAGQGSRAEVGPDRAGRCFFSPRGGCTTAVVAEVAAAQHSIELQGYSFTSEPIATALIQARRRGVDVRLLLDAAATGDDRRQAIRAREAGASVYLDGKHGLAHNKVILIDHRTLITGSFDFTAEAEDQNAENVLILHDQPKLQSAYEENFQAHWAHGERFEGK
ncbi:MAG TPA: phospholipase D family protein [Tepidisphaeraceae bacterium]|jgi:phosphatidylserine/phosphatidylglycerophosphate/cardiolipin synthase-like enzyme